MAAQELKRILGRGFSAAACVGAIIGLGILRTPGEIAATITDPWIYMSLWVACGIFVMCSLLFVGELMALTPKSGGPYQLIRRAYGGFPAFVMGWVDWVSYNSTVALKAVVVATYLAMLIPALGGIQTWVAIGITSTFAALQLIGTRGSASIQEVASTAIGLIIVALAVALFVGDSPDLSTAPVTMPTGSPAAWGLVAASIIFTYDGWGAATYTSGEVKSGGRGVVMGSIYGVSLVVGLYILLNLALVLAVPLDSLVGEELALAAALGQQYGQQASTLLIGAGVFILLAHQNLNYMFTARIVYALSNDGLGTKRATNVTDNGAPVGGVIISWAMIVAMIFIGSFEFLINLTVVLFLLLYVVLMLGVFRLRQKEPDTPRPYRAWGYPYVGFLCVAGWAALTLFIGFASPDSTLFGLALIVAAAPVYWWLRKVRHLDDRSGAVRTEAI